MADAVTEVSTKRGYDAREFSLLAVGGGGPLCGGFVAELLSIPRVIMPKFAPAFCAWSLFSLNVGRDFVRPYICPVNKADIDKINKLYQEMVKEALNEFNVLNVREEDLIIEKSAEVRYKGQYHEIEMPMPAGDVTSKDLQQLIKDFHQKHEELYTFFLPWEVVEFRNLRLIVYVRKEKPKMKEVPAGTEDPSEALKRKRLCFFNGSFVDTPIYDATKLKSGNIIDGHAIIEEPITTVVVPPDFRCRVDRYGNYIMERR
jgi:N-methylhydantoinase A